MPQLRAPWQAISRRPLGFSGVSTLAASRAPSGVCSSTDRIGSCEKAATAALFFFSYASGMALPAMRSVIQRGMDTVLRHTSWLKIKPHTKNSSTTAAAATANRMQIAFIFFLHQPSCWLGRRAWRIFRLNGQCHHNSYCTKNQVAYNIFCIKCQYSACDLCTLLSF